MLVLLRGFVPRMVLMVARRRATMKRLNKMNGPLSKHPLDLEERILKKRGCNNQLVTQGPPHRG